MADALTTARPPHAVVMWCDRGFIYTELPATNGGLPYIQKHSLTEGGLSKALAMMRDLYAKHQPLGGDYNIPLNPLIRVAPNSFSSDQRSAALDALRKLKVI